MEAWKNWRRLLLTAVAAIGFLIMSAPDARAFFIRGGTPPPPPPPSNQGNPPPQEGGNPPPPPPPTGGGETPPGGGDVPPPPPPVQGAPEPASLTIGMLGAGLASLVAWRRRQRKTA